MSTIQEQIGEILAEHKRQILELTFQRQTAFEDRVNRKIEEMEDGLTRIEKACSTYLKECEAEDAEESNAIPLIQRDLRAFGAQLDALWQTFSKPSQLND